MQVYNAGMQIYFDQAATSYPKAPGVAKAMAGYITGTGANINRGSYGAAGDAAMVVLETREKLCRLFGFDDPEYAVFTPGNTYALNQVLFGCLQPGDHVITSSMEHNAVMRPLHLQRSRGVTYTCVANDSQGRLDPGDIQEAILPNTRLVVLGHASNVSGALVDLAAIGRICHQAGIPLCVDAAQSAGHIPIDFAKLGLSALCVPGHKGLRGPQGIGALLLDPGFAKGLAPLVLGGTGSQSDSLVMPVNYPDHLEAGTLNLPGIYGLSAALDYLLGQDMAALHQAEMALCQQFLEGLVGLDGVRIIGPVDTKDRLAVVSLDFVGKDNALVTDWLLMHAGLCLRCGLHCAPMAHKTLGSYPGGTVRFSFNHSNTSQQVEVALQAVRDCVGEMG